MKKLMVMALIAGAAVTTFGAASTWVTGWTYWGGVGSELQNESGSDQFVGNAYLFTGLSEAQYQALTSAADIWDNFTAAGDDSTLKIGANTLTVTDWGALVDGGLDFTKTTTTEFPAGPAYAAVVVTHEDGLGTVDAYSANAMYATSGLSLEGADQVALTWGDGRSIGTPTIWQANSIPEPTSGLLLLLGVAGLALRRRRA